MGRAPCCDKANVKRGPWSPEEDAKLKDYMEKNGTGGNWIALPMKAGLRRCGKSCRLRWLNYLRPDIKHGGFTEVEDDIICTLYRKLGSRWSIIASQLPGRTDNDVKNYWNTKLKKKVLTADAGAATTKPKNNQQVPSARRGRSPPSSVRAIPVEPNDLYSGPSVPARDSGGIELVCQQPTSFPSSEIGNAYVVSPPHDMSAASSSLTIDSGGGGGYIAQWLECGVDVGGGDIDGFFTDMGFGCTSDFLNWYGMFDRSTGGELAEVPGGDSSSPHISNLWADGAHNGNEQKPYQTVTKM